MKDSPCAVLGDVRADTPVSCSLKARQQQIIYLPEDFVFHLQSSVVKVAVWE